MDDITIRLTRLITNEATFTKEEIEDSIEVAMDRLSKAAVRGKVTMKGIVSFLQKIGLPNKPEYRKKAVKIIKDMGLKIATV